MRSTPAIPDSIRRAHVPGYVTAHQLLPEETCLYGTEDLYGDWGGEILLLAKDWGPSSIMEARVAAGELRAYRHDPRMKANRRLRVFADPFRDRGLLYGSALANLLRADRRVTGSLPNRPEAIAYGTEVTRFAIDHMPSLRWVMCLGLEAWECASGALGLVGDWRRHRDAGEPLGKLIAAYHPSARVSNDRMAGPWELLARLVREDLPSAA